MTIHRTELCGETGDQLNKLWSKCELYSNVKRTKDHEYQCCDGAIAPRKYQKMHSHDQESNLPDIVV